MPAAALILALAAVAFWAVDRYKRLVRLRIQLKDEWRRIDQHLKRRHDLIPNLVDALRSSMELERDALTAVMDAQSRALIATGPTDAAQKEQQLSLAIGTLLAAAESRSLIGSHESAKVLQEELSVTEHNMAFARQSYNEIATKYNTAQQVFLVHRFSGVLGFGPAEFFEVPESTEDEAPVVDLSRRL